MQRVAALGSPDMEMQRIESLLTRCGVQVVYAVNTAGMRVRPQEAYSASFGVPVDQIDLFVECGSDAAPTDSSKKADHHRPGDFGYDLGPDEFMAASSIGQVIAWLARQGTLPDRWIRNRYKGDAPSGVFVPRSIPDMPSELFSAWEIVQGDFRLVVPEAYVLTAAADHCLSAAYAGRCHGVSHETLWAFRRYGRSALLKVDEWSIARGWQSGLRALTNAPTMIIGGYEVLDLRNMNVPHMNEVLAQTGNVGIFSSPCGPEFKVSIIGAGLGSRAGTGPVEAFLDLAPQMLGLERMYGSPVRGFAGGFRRR